ncbi:hypothetical protein KIL84_003862 [Mauremys mutica]|uniref:Uncharacterized protein n=1 Tax=Mauremys mutica TaxID=74926 RepID=A0A9D3WUL0_9SAUR|nr:hypothetical protein KIL84_003862 [Mauremys mutica]
MFALYPCTHVCIKAVRMSMAWDATCCVFSALARICLQLWPARCAKRWLCCKRVSPQCWLFPPPPLNEAVKGLRLVSFLWQTLACKEERLKCRLLNKEQHTWAITIQGKQMQRGKANSSSSRQSKGAEQSPFLPFLPSARMPKEPVPQTWNPPMSHKREKEGEGETRGS